MFVPFRKETINRDSGSMCSFCICVGKLAETLLLSGSFVRESTLRRLAGLVAPAAGPNCRASVREEADTGLALDPPRRVEVVGFSLRPGGGSRSGGFAGGAKRGSGARRVPKSL